MHTPHTLRSLAVVALLGAAFAAHALPTPSGDCTQPWPPAPRASSTPGEGCGPLRQMINPQPLPPRHGGFNVAVNPQPLPPRHGGFTVAKLNPQPLPPRRARGFA